MSNVTNLLTPVGRLVQGGPFEFRDTNMDGKPLTDSNGNPRKDYYMAIAIAKNDPNWAAFKAQVDAVAQAAWPHHHNTPTFSNKIIDGDSQVPDTNGVRPCDKEGFAGHWVVRFSSGFAPDVYTKGGAARITDQEQVKRGHFIRIYGSCKSNNSTSKPGLYMNLSAVEHIAFGEEITSGPDAASIFGAAPVAALPAGASEVPTAPATPIAVAPQQPQPAPATPAPNPQVQPAPDFLNAAPPAPAAPKEPEMIEVNGHKYTREALTAAGWTDAQIQQAIENSLPM